MLKYLNEIIELGEDLLENNSHSLYEDHCDELFVEIIAKANIFFHRLEEDPLELNEKLTSIETDIFSLDVLFKIIKILRKAKVYFDKIDENDVSVWKMMHPLLKSLCKRKFENGDYADAVETALKEVNNLIKIKYKKTFG